MPDTGHLAEMMLELATKSEHQHRTQQELLAWKMEIAADMKQALCNSTELLVQAQKLARLETSIAALAENLSGRDTSFAQQDEVEGLAHEVLQLQLQV